MTPEFESVSVYTDLHSLQRLKAASREHSPESLRAVANQFEALFIQMMLKSARQATSAGMFTTESEQMGFYREMFDQQLAVSMAESGPVGIADLIVEQLSVAAGSTSPTPNTEDDPARDTSWQLRRLSSARAVSPAAGGMMQPDVPASPQEFARRLWPHARVAARELGVTPEAIVAHAALESGWGRAMPVAANGGSSNNLFGIKADRSWPGPQAVSRTLEAIDGRMERQLAAFRVYASYQESAADYVRFLRSNPRYEGVLGKGQDALAYFRGLQNAGYATDPDYAQKLTGILEAGVLPEALMSLKSEGQMSILEDMDTENTNRLTVPDHPGEPGG